MTDQLPRFSASEERAFKTCRLAHYFEYELGYRLKLPNRKLSNGIIFHLGVGAHYEGHSDAEVRRLIEDESDKRWAEINAANAEMPNYAEALATFQKDREMLLVMVQGYIDWIHQTGLDDQYETVETEVAHEVVIPGAVATIPVRMDLVQRNKVSGRLRLVDFKTARSIPNDLTGYMMSEQNGNYQLATLAVFNELPTEMAYRFARKIIPSGRTKPPYFAERRIHLTKKELLKRIEIFKAVSADRFDPNREIYPQPDNCCGSWKHDWQKPCLRVHGGADPLTALQDSPGYEPSDAYARYHDLEDE